MQQRFIAKFVIRGSQRVSMPVDADDLPSAWVKVIKWLCDTPSQREHWFAEDIVLPKSHAAEAA